MPQPQGAPVILELTSRAQTPPPRVLLHPLSPFPCQGTGARVQQSIGIARQGCPLSAPIDPPGSKRSGSPPSPPQHEMLPTKHTDCCRGKHLLYIVDTIYRILNFLPTSRQLWK